MRSAARELPEKSSVPHLGYVLVKRSSKMEGATTLEFFFLSWAKLLWMELCGECQDLRRTGRRARETELDDANLRTFPRHRPRVYHFQARYTNTPSTMATALAVGFGIAATAFFVRHRRISSATIHD